MKAVAAGRPDVLGHSGMLGLQRAAGNSAAAGAVEEERSPVHDVVSGGGAPLDDGVRADMEARMGQDFGDVRVHTGDTADASARSVSAHAYTVGSNIVFQRGSYDPGSSSGQTLLAHELTHVVQQRTGPVDGTPAAGGVSVSDPSDRFERRGRDQRREGDEPAGAADGATVRAAHDRRCRPSSARGRKRRKRPRRPRTALAHSARPARRRRGRGAGLTSQGLTR